MPLIGEVNATGRPSLQATLQSLRPSAARGLSMTTCRSGQGVLQRFRVDAKAPKRAG